jgi:hypothetical protein
VAGGVATLVDFTVYRYPAFTGFVLVLTFHTDQVEAKITKQTDYRVAQRVSKVTTVLNTTPELPHQSTEWS